MNCGVGHRHDSDPVFPWLWCKPAATAPILPLAWELPYVTGAAKKKKKERKKRKEKKKKRSQRGNGGIQTLAISLFSPSTWRQGSAQLSVPHPNLLLLNWNLHFNSQLKQFSFTIKCDPYSPRESFNINTLEPSLYSDKDGQNIQTSSYKINKY